MCIKVTLYLLLLSFTITMTEKVDSKPPKLSLPCGLVFFRALSCNLLLLLLTALLLMVVKVELKFRLDGRFFTRSRECATPEG